MVKKHIKSTIKIIDIINGEKVCNEINGFEEIAIFKDGVTL